MDRFTNSTHMEMLEIIIVHGVILSNPDSASSLASLAICAFLLGLVSTIFLATKMHYVQTLNRQVQHNDRALHL